MRILVTGASGLVGTALRGASADEYTALTHGEHWDTAAGTIDAARLEGHDAVVHLAGDNIASGRWNKKKKACIHDSRVEGTKLLCEALAGLDKPPSVLLSASAIGYYGHRYGEKLHEYADPGKGFLVDVCTGWESATKAAKDAGIRVVNMRLGLVLSTDGGPLTKMLTPFKLCVGGKLGDGQQYMSWITLDDAVAAMHHCLEHTEIEGPVNLTAPGSVTNKEFTKTLGKVLRRPTIFPMPKPVARIIFGEMADPLLFYSARCVPERLDQTGFRFAHPELEGALRHVLGL